MKIRQSKRIVVTGPESSGKSTLSKQLAIELEANYMPEYAREYIDQLDRPYEEWDIEIIAKKQYEKTLEIRERFGNYIVFDTSYLVLKIWSEFKYKRCSSLINRLLVIEKPDLYVLCGNEIPWEYDEQRENPSPRDRRKLYTIYKKELEKIGVPFIEVRGSKEKRLAAVLKKLKEA